MTAAAVAGKERKGKGEKGATDGIAAAAAVTAYAAVIVCERREEGR